MKETRHEKVLLVSDDKDSGIYEAQLIESGYDVVVAHTIREVDDVFRAIRDKRTGFYAVVLDGEFQGGGGWERIMRDMLKTNHQLPVFLHTPHSRDYKNYPRADMVNAIVHKGVESLAEAVDRIQTSPIR